MQNYELMLILPGTLSEDEVDPLLEKVSKIIEEAGALNLSVVKLEKRRLAYPMKHIRYGYFNLVYFDAEPEMVVDIQNKLRLMPELLRALLQKHDPVKQTSRTIEFGLPMTGQSRDERFVGGEESGRNNRFVPREEPAKASLENVQEKVEVISVVEEESVAVEEPKESLEVEEKKEEAPVEKVKDSKPTDRREKVDMAEIDKKLDEILDIDLSNV